MSKASFIVVEQQFLLRKGISSLLNELPNATVVREADSSDRLFELTRQHAAKGIIINLSLLKKLPEKCLSKLIKKRVIILGLSYNSKIEEHENEVCIDIITMNESKESIIKKLKIAICQMQADTDSQNQSSDLSEREIEIVRDVALGLSNKEIAEKNFISPHTVITHRKNITRKLGIKTVSGLTVYAIINKLVGLEEVN